MRHCCRRTRVYLPRPKPRFFVLENVYALTYNNKASRPAFNRLLSRDRPPPDTATTGAFSTPPTTAFRRPAPAVHRWRSQGASSVPELPEPTHGGHLGAAHRAALDRPHVTAGEALAGLVTDPEPSEVVRGSWGHLLPAFPQGTTTCTTPPSAATLTPSSSGAVATGPSCSSWTRTEPAPTIQAQPGPNVGPFHWDNRRLRVAELKRLFTFPDEFELVGTRNRVQAQLGNSVPPLLAQRVVEQVAAVS